MQNQLHKLVTLYIAFASTISCTTPKSQDIVGRYHNGSDGSIVVSTSGDKLFMKYLRDTVKFEMFKISDSTYITHDTKHAQLPVQFIVNPADGRLNYVFLEEGKPLSFIHPKESDTVRVPYEYLRDGDFDKALAGYRKLMADNPNDKAVDEVNMESQAAALEAAGKRKLAGEVRRVNEVLHSKE